MLRHERKRSKKVIVLRIEVKETTLEIPQESFQDFFKEYLFPNQFLTAASFFIHDAKFIAAFS